MRKLTPLDKLFSEIDKGLRAVHANGDGTGRPRPGKCEGDAGLSETEKAHAASLMRVNHAGEIAAQALYNGQALGARKAEVRQRLQQSALEETDHLAWCRERVETLGQSVSRLAPFWYWGSFAIGLAAGLAGDRWSLGFIKETEDQVGEHLRGHLRDLPEQDECSRAIVEQMIVDEQHHGEVAMSLGGKTLPPPAPAMMRLASKVMTTLSYRI